MELNNEIDLTKRKYSSRLIVERALARDWQVQGFTSNPALFIITIPGKAPLKIFSASPPQMPYPSALIADDKFITNRLLEAGGLPVPPELLISDPALPDPALLEQFLQLHQKVVVKPLDGSHGNGITVNITDMADLQAAIVVASKSKSKKNIIIQKQIDGIDIRILVIDYRFIDAMSRIPASVKGDGKHTVRELIAATNASDERGENYQAELNIIPLNNAEKFLGAAAMEAVPSAGQTVQVIGVSNVGQGGVRINSKQVIPPFLQEIAIQAAKILELPVCGIDFFVKDIPRPDSTLEDLAPFIIEANKCPSLTMYGDLQSPDQLAIVDTYLDLLEKY